MAPLVRDSVGGEEGPVILRTFFHLFQRKVDGGVQLAVGGPPLLVHNPAPARLYGLILNDNRFGLRVGEAALPARVLLEVCPLRKPLGPEGIDLLERQVLHVILQAPLLVYLGEHRLRRLAGGVCSYSVCLFVWLFTCLFRCWILLCGCRLI